MISFDIDDIDILKEIPLRDVVQLQLAIGLSLDMKRDEEVKFTDGRYFIIRYHD